ncbi:acyltransferase [Mesorhizobium sp. M2A.F.Ca.ET.043.05.1.1]|uniref:acyltransferase n=1 Tax=Mesorhizobium sp. M2A.F.Ca.ET.043.05.1.1 TaxID=2493671 RepID=UPI00167B74DD|nr:acyltransferase [Mesorhizobium sp. M2A.F.Ca.ET.043.05.1.1]
MSASAQDFRPDIEGLRAVAVAGVVACHFGLAALPGGFAGVVFVISGLVSFILCAWLTSVSQPWAFYFSPLRAWEFAAGGLASMAPARLLQERPLLGRALSLAGLAMIGAAYPAFSEDAPFPGFLALLPVAGTVLLLKAGAAGARDGYSPDCGRNWVNAALALPPLQWIGRLALFDPSVALAAHRLCRHAGAGADAHRAALLPRADAGAARPHLPPHREPDPSQRLADGQCGAGAGAGPPPDRHRRRSRPWLAFRDQHHMATPFEESL